MWLTNFRLAYLSACLDLLWRQWSAFGLLGQERWSENSVLDPEALLVSTLHFGRFDPRLFDACVDWWLTNEQWLSPTRLRRLRRSLPLLEKRILATVADVVVRFKKSARWKNLAAARTLENPRNTEVLFQLANGEPLPMVGVPDPIFRSHGFLRPKLESRKVSGKLPMDTVAVARMKLRALLGVTSRAEIVLYLLTNESGHPQLVATRGYYAQPSISVAMAQMAKSGMLLKERRRREVEYSLKQAEWRRFFAFPRSMEWVDWGFAFDALRSISVCLQGLGEKKLSTSLLGAELRRCAKQVNVILHSSSIKFRLNEEAPRSLEAYSELSIKDVKNLLHVLGGKLKVSLSPQEA